MGTIKPNLLRASAVAVVYAVFATAQYYAANRAGAFWWFDSASHALNGLFIRDLFSYERWFSPLSFAMAYFAHYPGLTLGFYPPGFAMLLAISYALFGISHAAAQIVVSAATFALALGIYALARRGGIHFRLAVCAGLLTVAFPEMQLWSRQIQPEIPAYALAAWSGCLLMRWLDEDRPWQLLLAAALFVSGLYVKQTIGFLAPAFLLVVVGERGWTIWRRREVLLSIVLVAALSVPLAVLTIGMGNFNLVQMVATPEHRSALQELSYYARILPEQVGWLPAAAAALGLVCLMFRRDIAPPATRRLLLGWVGFGFAFFTAIALKGPRFSTAVLPGVALLAVIPICLPRLPRWADVVVVVAAVGIAVHAFAVSPQRIATGHREAAEYAAKTVLPDSNILLLAHRSANFIFAMRVYASRADVRTLRAEKLYTKYTVSQAFGKAEDTGADESALLSDLQGNNVSVVVLERGFWDDVPVIHRLHQLVRDSSFALVKSVPLRASDEPEKVGYLDIYRRLNYVQEKERDVTIDIPLIGGHFTLPASSGL